MPAKDTIFLRFGIQVCSSLPEILCEKEWGKPSGASKRFWGGETWTYYRIAGGTQRILGGINPHECEITLYFNKEGKLDDYSYSSGC